MASKREPYVWFCACCGHRPVGEAPKPFERMCSKCGVGLLLEAAAEIAPAPTDPFVVVGNDFEVAAISHYAEELLGVHERSVIGHRLTELLLPADGDPHGASALVAAVEEAASGAAGARPLHLRLRAVNHSELELHARLGRCGPPVGALIVLEPTAAERATLLGRG